MRELGKWVGRGFGGLVVIVLAAAMALALFGLGFSGGVGDRFVEVQEPGAPLPLDIVITEFSGSTVTLEGAEGRELGVSGLWGIDYVNGYGQVTDVVSVGGDAVTRQFTKLAGQDPVPGTVARFDPTAWTGGPEAIGLAARQVFYSSELGTYPSLQIGTGDTWMIVVHHKGTSLDEGLRIAAIAVDAGVQVLLISYRNDPDAPPDPRGIHRWGSSEWRDLEAAVAYARSQGANSIFLAGYGMGGSIVLSFLDESDLAAHVAGAVLDSPIIDLEATVTHDLSQAQLGALFDMPTAFNWSSRVIAGWRFNLDWDDLDYGDTPARVPTLIFHGDADVVAPLAVSQRYAAANRALVTLVVVPGAGFTESWNVDRAGYAAAVTTFLEEL